MMEQPVHVADFQKRLAMFQKKDKSSEQKNPPPEKEVNKIPETTVKTEEVSNPQPQSSPEKEMPYQRSQSQAPPLSFQPINEEPVHKIENTQPVQNIQPVQNTQPINAKIDTSELQNMFRNILDNFNKNIQNKIDTYQRKVENAISNIPSSNQSGSNQSDSNINSQIQQQMDEISDLKNQISTSEERIMNLISQNNEYLTNLIQQQTTEINTLKIQISKIPTDISSISMPQNTSGNEEQMSALNDLNIKLSEKQLTLNEIEGKIRQKEDELNRIEKDLEEKNEKHSGIISSIDSASKELFEIHSQIELAMNELNETKRQNESLKNENQFENNFENQSNIPRQIQKTEGGFNRARKLESKDVIITKDSYGDDKAIVLTNEEPIQQNEEPIQENEEPIQENEENIPNESPEEYIPEVADPNNPTLPEVIHKFKEISKHIDKGSSIEKIDASLETLSWPERNLIEVYSIGQNCKSIFAFNPFYSEPEEIEVEFETKFPSFHSYINVSPYVYLSGGKYEEESAPSSPNFYRFRRTDKKYFSKEDLAPMREGRKFHTIVYVPYSKEICAIGGTKMKSCERYSIDNNEWNDLPNLLNSRERSSCCVYNDTFLYVFFGFDRSKSHYITTIERINLEEPNIWESISVPGNQNFLKKQSFALLYDNEEKKVLIVGGLNASRKVCKDIIEYSFEENKATFQETALPVSASFNESGFTQLFNGSSYIYTENFMVLKFDSNSKEFISVE
ncbi:MAG: hypothetical protein MJ252_14350 [archaeon]|nr:hypothetical protein [archaeon]